MRGWSTRQERAAEGIARPRLARPGRRGRVGASEAARSRWARCRRAQRKWIRRGCALRWSAQQERIRLTASGGGPSRLVGRNGAPRPPPARGTADPRDGPAPARWRAGAGPGGGSSTPRAASAVGRSGRCERGSALELALLVRLVGAAELAELLLLELVSGLLALVRRVVPRVARHADEPDEAFLDLHDGGSLGPDPGRRAEECTERPRRAPAVGRGFDGRGVDRLPGAVTSPRAPAARPSGSSLTPAERAFGRSPRHLHPSAPAGPAVDGRGPAKAAPTRFHALPGSADRSDVRPSRCRSRRIHAPEPEGAARSVRGRTRATRVALDLYGAGDGASPSSTVTTSPGANSRVTAS